MAELSEKEIEVMLDKIAVDAELEEFPRWGAGLRIFIAAFAIFGILAVVIVAFWGFRTGRVLGGLGFAAVAALIPAAVAALRPVGAGKHNSDS